MEGKKYLPVFYDDFCFFDMKFEEFRVWPESMKEVILT